MDLSLWESGLCAYMYHKGFCCIHSPTHKILSAVAAIYLQWFHFPSVSICQCHFPNSQFGLPPPLWVSQWSSSTSPCPVINRPFPLTSKYVWNPWRHVWGASEGLLGRIFYCYIREYSLRSDSDCLRVQENRKLPRRRCRVSTLAFSTVVVRTLCDFFRHCRGAVRWTCLVCTQRFVLACKCLLMS